MKKTNFLALLMAIALASTFSLSACSSSDEVTSDNAEPNPTYDGTSVRTDFAFNITKASQTRMSAANVQEGGDAASFLGMKDMYLIPFTAEPTNSSSTNLTTTPAYYSLGSLATAEMATKSSKVYSLSIPVGTSDFLFYGKANNSATDFEKGKITDTYAGTTSDISFALNSIVTSLGNDATNIASYLTAIAKTSYTNTTVNPNVTTTWASAVTERNTDANYSSLADMYTKFTTNIVDYSGSTESIQRLVFDLYKSAYAINAQLGLNTTVVGIAKEICKKIENTSGTVRLVVKNEGAAISITDDNPASATTADSWTAELEDVPTNFPANLNLPMGAALVKWDGTKFVYVDNPLYTSGVGNLSASTEPDKYTYPAELIYFDNSPLIATANYKTVANYPTTTANWDLTVGSANGFTSDWKQKSVQASTRAVAMKYNVNYGVALLESTVALASEFTNFTDNMSNVIPGASDQANIATDNFEVTGLLIGGQPASVDWDMTNPNDGFAHVIYDHDVQYGIDGTTGHTLSTTGSANNYTVVLDNYKTGDTQPDVRIALELKNKGNDFYGADGMIPAGSTFYLVGNLALSSAGNHTIPQINGEARSSVYRITKEATKRVFIQDYKTVANIKLSANALKSAYSAIPDLRSTEVLFGLSVDLKWESGITFNVDM